MYASYVRAFRKYAQSLMGKSLFIKKLWRFMAMLTAKANELLDRAALNKLINVPKLQKELAETTKAYIRRFSALLRLTEDHQPKEKSKTFEEKDD